ncbi:MAG: radical SAM protein [Candidatus Omnitrophica bacterium]|nr:radical SAM protein [Candidatus Omnitrophota bacterium]
MKLKYKIPIALRIAKAKIFHKKIPVLISWAATYRCNQRCLYCKMPSLVSDELSSEQVKMMIDKLNKLGAKVLNITGGEALLRGDIFDLIEYFKAKGIYVCLNSNGILVPENINRLKILDLLNLSIEGPREVHDSIRGPGAYQTVIKAAQAALQSKIKVNFTATINKHNIIHLDYIIGLARELKLAVRFEILEEYMLGSKSKNSLEISPAQVQKALAEIIWAKNQAKYRKTIINSLGLLTYLQSWPELKYLQCASGNIIFRVTPQGIMFVCAKATYENTQRTNYSIDLINDSTAQIKAKLASWAYPDRECSCACSSRQAVNLVWNLKF